MSRLASTRLARLVLDIVVVATVAAAPGVSALSEAQSAVAYRPSAAGLAAEQSGLAAARRSDFREARAQFLAARDSDPYWPENLYYLGLATSKLPGLELSAAAWFEAYLALEPKSPRAAEIRATIDRLVQAGRSRAALLVDSMERMAAQFQPDEIDALKAHGAVLMGELALLEPAHSSGIYTVGDGAPQLNGDTTRAWAAALWMQGKGVDSDRLAHEFAKWGRVELSSRILGKGQFGENWIDFIPELVAAGYLNEITARTMFRPADFLRGLPLALEPLCRASVALAARQFVLIDSYNRQEAMDTLGVCAVAVVHSTDSESLALLHPLLADLVEFYLEDGNSKAAWQIYGKMTDPRYGEFDPLARAVRQLIEATQAVWDGKPGAKQQAAAAKEEVGRLHHLVSAAAAFPAAAMPSASDPYAAQKFEEEHRAWDTAAPPVELIDAIASQHGPLFSPREAADLWTLEARDQLAGAWFERYAEQLEALRNYASPGAIDKAGALFSATASAAKNLLDGVTALTACQRLIVIYRPPAVPLPYTWKKAQAASAAK